MRLLPRFSLRFAWIALTIFLIVFAVGASYWNRYHNHERLVKVFEQQGCAVEEVPLTILGFEVGKKLVGVEVHAHDDGAYLELLQQLPNLDEFRRFGTRDPLTNQTLLDRLFETLSHIPHLEELYLQNLIFTREQARGLARYSHLRVLDLSNCNIPTGGLSFLSQLTELETLILDGTTFNINELYAVSLPKLKLLNLSRCRFKTLELTKDGWGHFPNLETLIVREHPLGRITSETGALPRLKHLDLGSVGEECQIEWEDWPTVIPNLVSLAMPTHWYDSEMLAMLEKLPQLRYLYLEDDSKNAIQASSVTEFSRWQPEDLKSRCPARLLPALQTLHRACPNLLFSDDYSAVYELHGPLLVTPHLWDSPYWRQSSPMGQAYGNFF